MTDEQNQQLGFAQALNIAQFVFSAYVEDYPKWGKRMTGTPIENDLPVRMAMVFQKFYAEPPKTSLPTITSAMIEEAAQRLVSWDQGCTWPDSWDRITVAAARQDAERALRSGLAALSEPVPVNEATQLITQLADELEAESYRASGEKQRFDRNLELVREARNWVSRNASEDSDENEVQTAEQRIQKLEAELDEVEEDRDQKDLDLTRTLEQMERLQAAQRQDGEPVAYLYDDEFWRPYKLTGSERANALPLIPATDAHNPPGREQVPEGYAGVKMWIGDREVTKTIPQHVIGRELESGSAITFVAQSVLNEMAGKPEPPEDT